MHTNRLGSSPNGGLSSQMGASISGGQSQESETLALYRGRAIKKTSQGLSILVNYPDNSSFSDYGSMNLPGTLSSMSPTSPCSRTSDRQGKRLFSAEEGYDSLKDDEVFITPSVQGSVARKPFGSGSSSFVYRFAVDKISQKNDIPPDLAYKCSKEEKYNAEIEHEVEVMRYFQGRPYTGMVQFFGVYEKSSNVLSEEDVFSLDPLFDDLDKQTGCLSLSCQNDSPSVCAPAKLDTLGFLMEMVEGNDLSQVETCLVNAFTQGRLNENEMWNILSLIERQKLSILKHIHQHSWVLGDIKPSHFKFTRHWILKYFDFGRSQQVGQPICCGHELYTAPEAFSSLLGKSAYAATALDCYALGQMMYQMIATLIGVDRSYYLPGNLGENEPFFSCGQRAERIFVFREAMEKFHACGVRGEYQGVFDINEIKRKKGGPVPAFIEKAIDYTNQLMHPDPKQRITSAEAIRHDFIIPRCSDNDLKATGLLAAFAGPAAEKKVINKRAAAVMI